MVVWCNNHIFSSMSQGSLQTVATVENVRRCFHLAHQVLQKVTVQRVTKKILQRGSGIRKSIKNFLQTAAIIKTCFNKAITQHYESLIRQLLERHFHALIAIRFEKGGLNQIYRASLVLSTLIVNINFVNFISDPKRKASGIK